jgi:hypothetical protein
LARVQQRVDVGRVGDRRTARQRRRDRPHDGRRGARWGSAYRKFKKSLIFFQKTLHPGGIRSRDLLKGGFCKTLTLVLSIIFVYFYSFGHYLNVPYLF